MEEILYAGLIGACSALLLAIIFGIPKLIHFLVTKQKNNDNESRPKHLSKRTYTIALFVILGMVIVALLVALIATTSTPGSEESVHAVTFFYNTGICFTHSSLHDFKEAMYTKYQDDTVYKVERFIGGYPSEPSPPTNEGLVFLGWYQNPECTEAFLFGHYEVNSDINLYAKWGK